MPLLCLHFRNNNPNVAVEKHGFAKQKLRMSAISLPIQQLTLVGYAVNLSKHASAATADVKIPDHIIVEIDGVTNGGVNILSPPKSDAEPEAYLQTHGIPLPLSDSLSTISMGMNPLNFVVNKRLNREINIHIKKYNDSHDIVDMTTHNTAAGVVSCDHVLLYFSYEFNGNF